MKNRQSGSERGFTIAEVLVAAIVLIILCVGVLTVFSYVVRMNSGNDLRMQALSVLQKEVEYYRSLKFVPGQRTAGDLSNHRPSDMREGLHIRPSVSTPGGRVFDVTAEVTNLPSGVAEEECTFKQITIRAVPQVQPNEGWLQNLGTNVTIQRVRSN